MLKSFAVSSLAFALMCVNAEEAIFRFKQNQVTFAFKLTDPSLIKHARALVYGNTTENPHIQGKIIKKPEFYNYPWGFTLDPDTISFFDAKNKTCNTGIRWAEYYLDRVCDTLLPGCHWCPDNSVLLEEVKTGMNVPMPPRKYGNSS
ncbi:hypothetical protein A0J61_07617 [Choanephora cucurbitarum]|uniref:BP74 N-terminal domain-containing protein n=1 Tax=Choanephora cucurbitarum TaxID=101091 RepID=A0A1C7N5P2_9FUNG|nr:hypothetical protein A0J61_07617 [Choanephora cucurbitarum]